MRNRAFEPDPSPWHGVKQVGYGWERDVASDTMVDVGYDVYYINLPGDPPDRFPALDTLCHVGAHPIGEWWYVLPHAGFDDTPDNVRSKMRREVEWGHQPSEYMALVEEEIRPDDVLAFARVGGNEQEIARAMRLAGRWSTPEQRARVRAAAGLTGDEPGYCEYPANREPLVDAEVAKIFEEMGDAARFGRVLLAHSRYARNQDAMRAMKAVLKRLGLMPDVAATYSIEWEDKPGNRSQCDPVLVFAMPDGTVHKYNGVDIVGVCAVTRRAHTKNGKWSFDEVTLSVNAAAKAYCLRRGGRFYLLTPENDRLEEHMIPYDNGGELRHIRSWTDVGKHMPADVFRALAPRKAEDMDAATDI